MRGAVDQLKSLLLALQPLKENIDAGRGGSFVSVSCMRHLPR